MVSMIPCLAFALALTPVGTTADSWELADARRADDALRTPSPGERLAYGRLVQALVAAAPMGVVPASAATDAAALGLELQRDGDRVWLMELASDARGWGVLGLRLGALPRDLVLQVPHPYFDLSTGPLGGALFDEGEARAICIATAHRYSHDHSDPAHEVETAFQAATLAVAAALPDPLFVQIHGFGASTTDADAVLSEGRVPMTAEGLEAARATLARALGADDLRLGHQVPALAARTNVQGLALAGEARFLHLELSASQRSRMLEDQAYRAAFGAALEDLAAPGGGAP